MTVISRRVHEGIYIDRNGPSLEVVVLDIHYQTCQASFEIRAGNETKTLTVSYNSSFAAAQDIQIYVQKRRRGKEVSLQITCPANYRIERRTYDADASDQPSPQLISRSLSLSSTLHFARTIDL